MLGLPSRKLDGARGGHQRVQLASLEQLDESLVLGDRLEIDAVGQHQRRAFVPPGLLLSSRAPVDLVRLHAVLVLHHAAHPDRRGHLVFGQADRLAAQILRLLDPPVGADIDPGMAEHARDESGNADERAFVARGHDHEAGERELAGIEFLESEGAEEHLFRLHRDEGHLATLDLDPTVLDRRDPIVIAARDG